MTVREVEQQLRMARAFAADQLPWFASALFSARLVVTEACPSLAAVDLGMRLYFNPRLVAALVAGVPSARRLRQLAFVWVHEISHVLRQHSDRASERCVKPIPWNMACDMEINDAPWEGLEPPRKSFAPLVPGDFGFPQGWLAESYYQRLKGRMVPTNRADAPLAAHSDVPRSWDEGSGVHGQIRPWELTAHDEDAPAIPALEQLTLREQVARQIQEQKSRGNLPAGWVRWSEEALQPKVDWRELLKRRTRGAIVTGLGQRLDYGFQRPHRRADQYAPVIRPSLQGGYQPNIACVIDTSGSIGKRELAQALAEVRSVLKSLYAPIVVIPCDAVPYEPVRVLTDFAFADLRGKLRGGGGTDMVAGIDAAVELQPPPDAVIVLTDGYTPYPKMLYRMPVIFGIFHDGTGISSGLKPPMPPWRQQDVIGIPLSALDQPG